MESFNNRPPQLFLKFLRWFCNKDYQEEIEGDLLERYNYHHNQFGKQKAKLLFIKELLSLFRPILLGNFNQLTTINITTMITKNRRLASIIIAILSLLTIPLIAMQFTKEVDWNISDFITMGILLLVTGILSELIMRKINTKKTKIITGLILLISFFVIWAELSVGVFNTPLAGN